MRIGIVGAPGSGKSALAGALANALDIDDDGVVDNYADFYGVCSDFAIGEDATYIVNLGIALERLERERFADDDFVTCGTMVDTAAYIACEATLFPEDPGWNRRRMASLALAGCMIADLVNYDFVFYLPLAVEPEETFFQNLSECLPLTLNLFEVPHVTLDRATPEDNVALALQAIKKGIVHATPSSE